MPNATSTASTTTPLSTGRPRMKTTPTTTTTSTRPTPAPREPPPSVLERLAGGDPTALAGWERVVRGGKLFVMSSEERGAE